MYGIALDLGTSGFRAQLIDLENKETVKTVITMNHPLPGGNVMDHLDFAIQSGPDIAHGIIIETIEKIFLKFDRDLSKIERLAVCGNPIQLSLFQNMEIRDLAYAGKSKQKKLGVENVKREARIFPADELFNRDVKLPNAEIIIPPAIKHEIGADALAMMIKTDFMNQQEISLVTDYGTNAEMALKIGDRIITGSAAAGPAIEGQGIDCGMLASPGAISNVNEEDGVWRLTVLNERMEEKKGYLIDPVTGEIRDEGEVKPKGITGTGVIAAISLAVNTGIIKKLPHLPNGKLILGEDIVLRDKDIEEAGKAIGAIRAAHLALLVESGVKYEDLKNMYMSGASGTYVDADKARKIGLVPNFSKKIVQFGNTSIALAKDLVMDSSKLDEISEIASRITADHLMMAKSSTFTDIYLSELSYWTHGMPLEMYNEMLEMYNIPKPPEIFQNPVIERRMVKDISDVGKEGIDIVREIGTVITEVTDGCIFCHKCETECPEDAITIVERNGELIAEYSTEKCLGTSCRRCVAICPESAIHYKDIQIKR
ncbi:4Fe-4S ferredoxin iron-sulfur binding domain protein [Methanosalsum zhilinae DSM 4017]|uniref:4Fe-4S ferredoxin iron-sulfur binding domain protein n=1 Tax=Methanosalsum zhilinae (strain DSM 4017 / NBRC 107636 / OCM 62 / WeN5) TaxID=679901 RepID=F7XPQ7_METZD|nr:methylamine methyltransferase corrinoid protein reductive activase [Methanosalsum zhilinae]AEH60327.1 4Fe-4S ferredoxin iron-sulfur binding domain protein [Methanosalsum zhilinae DSM 4017]